MINIAEFQIIGRVVRTKQVGSALKVDLAANYRFKDGDEWKDDTHFNQVTIFSDGIQGYIERNIDVGDLVFVRGRMRDTSFQKNGETVYVTERIANEFSLQAKARDQRDEG